MSTWLLTLYKADDTTVLTSYSTDRSHARPYLRTPTDLVESSVNLAEGSSRIGQINVVVQDNPMIAGDQDGGHITGVLAVPAGEEGAGYSALVGRRAVLQQSDETGTFLVLDGVVGDVLLSEDLVSYSLSLRDVRERERKHKAFTRSGTTTILPRGVKNGYGALSGGGWLVPPTKPYTATASVSTSDVVTFKLPSVSPKRSPVERIIPAAVLESFRAEMVPWIPLVALASYRPTTGTVRNVSVMWRVNSESPWTEIIDPLVPISVDSDDPATQVGFIKFFQGEHNVPLGSLTSVDVLTEIRVVIPAFADHRLYPSDGQQVEVMIVRHGEPTKDFPFHFEGTFGELLRNLYRGDYSEVDRNGNPVQLGIRYDEAAVLALNTPCRLRLTEPVDDLRKWVEENIYQPIGAAPALNTQGAVSPIRYALPTGTDPLFHFDNSNVAPDASWEQGTDVVNLVRVTYARDYRIPQADDPVGQRSGGDTLVSRKVVSTHSAAASIALFGEKALEMEPATLRAIGGVDAQPITGDVASETGTLLAAERARQATDRFLFGAQTVRLRCQRSASAGVRVGDWALLALSWLPDYTTGRRGCNRLVQVVSVRDLDPAWREFVVEDAGPANTPLGLPTLSSSTADPDGVVRVNVATIPAGAEVLVNYAISATVPPTTSGLWMPLGRRASPGMLSTPLLPAGQRIWVRGRSESPGRIRSAWTSPTSVVTPSTPRVRDVVVSINSLMGEATVTWTPNAYALGVLIYYSVHEPESPPIFNFLSVSAPGSASPFTLPDFVPPGQSISIKIHPYSGWTGSETSGTEGTPWEATATRAAVPASAVARGHAKMVDPPPNPNSISVRVEALEPTDGTIRLLAVRGSTVRTDGPVADLISEVGIWTFQRGPATGGPGEVEFVVEAPGYAPDFIIVPIAEQGRDTYALSVEIEQQPATPTNIPVRVRVWDPYPGGTGSVTVRPVGPYGANVTPASRTLTPGATRAAAGTADFTVSRGPSGTGLRRVSFVAEANGRMDGIDAIDVPAQDPVAPVYTNCLARVVDASATEIQVEVSATPPGAMVALVGVRGSATLIEGDGAGEVVPSGRTWKFSRGAALGGGGQVEFRATLANATPDSDMVEIPEQGRDTVYLSTLARVDSATKTDVNVRVYVADPYPQGPDSVTVAAAGVGVGSITPALERKLWPSNDLDTTSNVLFTIRRPGYGSPPGRVTFTARANGRVKDSDAVDIPAQDPNIPVYTECAARVLSAGTTATQVTVEVTATPPNATVQLVNTTGSTTLLDGPGKGLASPSTTKWTFRRGAALGGSGQAEFRAVLEGAVSDTDFVEIPEQGRDTVGLLMQARVQSTSAEEIVVRVAVADPYPQGRDSITVKAAGVGVDALTPAGPLILRDPTESLDNTGSVTFTIRRPAFGSPPGRVTFTALANGRVSDSDAVDVPAQDPKIPVYTTCLARVVDTSATTISVQVTTEPAGAMVALVGVRKNATLIEGDGEGEVVPSGRIWKFQRGPALGGPGQVEFRATLADATPDSDMVEIPEQGRDTVYLSTLARASTTTDTHVNVLVYVADPYPQGPDSVTVAAAGVGVGSITPEHERKLWPSSDLDTTSNVFFSIERPPFGSPPGRVTFTARANNRVKDSDAIDVPSQDPVIPVIPVIPKLARGTARIVPADTTATVVAVQVTTEPSNATVRLMSIRGSATRIDGAAQGVAVPSGRTWKFSRGAALGGAGQAEFVVEAEGYVSDPVFFEIPEQGRDTVGLAVSIDVQITATQYVAQVYVTDPFPQGTNSVTVTPDAKGVGTLNPVGAQVLTPTLDPSTSGSRTWTIQRPTAGSPPGRVTFIATAVGRVRGVDAIDVVPRDPTLPVPRKPSANLVLAETLGTSGRFVLTGDPGDAVGALEWRTWSRLSIEPEQAPPDNWSNLPLPQTIAVAGHKSYEKRIYAQVRVGALVSAIVSDAMPPILDGALSSGGSRGRPQREVDEWSGSLAGSPGNQFSGAPLRDVTGTIDLFNPNTRRLGSGAFGPGGEPMGPAARGGIRGDLGLQEGGAVGLSVPRAHAAANLPGLSSTTGKVNPNESLDGPGSPRIVHNANNVSTLADGPTVTGNATRAGIGLDQLGILQTNAPIARLRPALPLAGPDGKVDASQSISGEPDRKLIRTNDNITALAGGSAAVEGANRANAIIQSINGTYRVVGPIDGAATIDGLLAQTARRRLGLSGQQTIIAGATHHSAQVTIKCTWSPSDERFEFEWSQVTLINGGETIHVPNGSTAYQWPNTTYYLCYDHALGNCLLFDSWSNTQTADRIVLGSIVTPNAGAGGPIYGGSGSGGFPRPMP